MSAEKSFLTELDSYLISLMQEAIAYQLFDNWVNSFDGNQFDLDYEMASRTRNARVRSAFNEFYQLTPDDTNYLDIGD